RAQMPEPWPVLNPPATSSLPGRSAALRRSRFRSRLTLAASLLILLIGQLVVARLFTGSAPFALEGERGKIEATHRPAPPAVPLSNQPKHETIRPSSDAGKQNSGRR